MSSADGGSWVNEPGTRQSRENCERVQREGQPIAGTVAETYLLGRGLQHPLWSELRWLPNARTGEGALIAPLTVDGELVGYQATFLDAFGRKSVIDPARQTWKLHEKKTPDAIFDLPCRSNHDEVVIADGLEDALSIWTDGRPRSRVIGLPGQWVLRSLQFPPGTRIVIAPDGDPPGSQGALWLQEGVDHLILLGCEVLLAPMPPAQTPKLDANEILKTAGVDGLRAWLDQAAPAKLSDDGEIRRLAKLGVLDYARERITAAKRLGISVKFLDLAVEQMRKMIADEEKDDFLDIDETRPWDDEVDGAELLDAVSETIGQYVYMTAAQRDCVALWVVFCHCFEAALSAPKLWITSAERRSGKTRLLELLKLLCPRAIKADAISPAMIPRVIEAQRPCLLLDEFDTLIKDNEALRGVINSGFDRGSVIIIGVKVGDDWVPQQFSPWCPQAIGGIGKVPDTIADRSFKIELDRKPRNVKVTRLRRRDTEPLDDLARKCVRWAKDNMAALVDAEPKVPTRLNDRAADAWETCIAIADLAGGGWDDRARSAAIAISGDSAVADDETIGVMLLSDIRDIFAGLPERRHVQTGKDIGKHIGSFDLIGRLNDMEHRPWPEIKRGQPMTQPALAQMLRNYHVTPGNLKEGAGKNEVVFKGYTETQFRVVWQRYLPPLPRRRRSGVCSVLPVESDDFAATSLRPQDFCASGGDFEGATTAGGSDMENPENASVCAGSSEVAAKTALYECGSTYTSPNGCDKPSISAIPGDQDATSLAREVAPNGATEGYLFASVEEGARYYMAMHPGWSLARIAKEVGVSTSRIEELFPSQSPIVTKVRSVMAEHPDWTPEQISKHIRCPKSAVNRALQSIGQ